MPRQGMKDYTFSFTTAGESRLPIAGNFYHVIEAPNDIEIEFNNSGAKLARAQGMGGSYEYSEVKVHSLVAQTVVIALGFGESFDSRATVNANITTAIEPANTLDVGGDVNIPASSSAQIIGADSTRRVVVVRNLGTATLRIGGNGIALATEGYPLEPGEKIGLATTAIVAAYNPDASAHDVSVLPIRNV